MRWAAGQDVLMELPDRVPAPRQVRGVLREHGDLLVPLAEFPDYPPRRPEDAVDPALPVRDVVRTCREESSVFFLGTDRGRPPEFVL
jgi:hypothetical protein